MKRKKEKLLTEVELELMSILWRLGEGTVGEVMRNLKPARKLVYTSVSTMLRILEQKKILKIRKEGRGHVYVPLVAKADYEEKSLNQLVTRVFDGEPASLVRRLVSTAGLTEADLKEIKSVLNERLKS